MSPESGPRFCLFGSAPDTGNLGVSALCHSVVAGITEIEPAAEWTVFDHGRGSRAATFALENGESTMGLRGGYHTRRLHRPESLWQIRAAGWLGWLGAQLNRGTRRIAEADAVLDISGGDSFSDIYGMHRFRSVCLPKLIALELGTPLVLLPQTYGPYASSEAESTAREIVRSSALAWARDLRSFDSLKELLGGEFDPDRHRSGVDVAFGLAVRKPAAVPDALHGWLEGRPKTPVAGLNVSGLIYGQSGASAQYGLSGGYESIVRTIAEGLIERGARVVLVPHVVGSAGGESDVDACRRLAAELEPEHGDRVLALDGGYDASGAKWVISQLDFFCGTRMHSCIAGLSTGVPTVGLAYSKKTRGVFDTVGQGDAVAELRSASLDEVLATCASVWDERDRRREALAAILPTVKGAARSQLVAILAAIGERA